jgi:hypothetical protein
MVQMLGGATRPRFFLVALAADNHAKLNRRARRCRIADQTKQVLMEKH